MLNNMMEMANSQPQENSFGKLAKYRETHPDIQKLHRWSNAILTPFEQHILTLVYRK